MNDVIEEIINDLQRVADRKCYPEDILSGSIAQEWIVYITKLQTDNKRLQHNEKVFKGRNEKAIEYVNTHKPSDTISFPLMKKDEENQVKSCFDYEFREIYQKELLEILQGSDKE